MRVVRTEMSKSCNEFSIESQIQWRDFASIAVVGSARTQGVCLKQKALFNATAAVQRRIPGFTCRHGVFPIYTRNGATGR